MYIVTMFVTREKIFMILVTCGKVINLLVTNITIAHKLTVIATVLATKKKIDKLNFNVVNKMLSLMSL